MVHKSVSPVQDILKKIHLRVSTVKGHVLTQSELAEVARVNARPLGEWIRGGANPPGMFAVLNLLAALPEIDVTAVLSDWRAHPQGSAIGSRISGKAQRAKKVLRRNNHQSSDTKRAGNE